MSANNEKKFESLSETRAELISMGTHQLRTYLSTSKWTISMLLDEDLGEITDEQRAYIEKLRENNTQMILLLNDMLEILHSEELKEAGLENFNIEEIAQKVISSFSGETFKRNIKMAFVKPDYDLPLAWGEKAKTWVILQNLIANAVKYSNPGGEVIVSAEKDTDVLKIAVKDTGIGISEENQAQLFKKFFRAEKAKEKEPIGSGLGLFIAKNFTVKQGGNLWFESKENEGSVFYFTIPVAKG